MSKPRLNEIEWLRSIAFIMVVIQHAAGVANFEGGVSQLDAGFLSIIFFLAKPAVPIFVFITGMVLFYNYYDKEVRYTEFLKKRAKEIVVPYVFWSIVTYWLQDTQAPSKSLADLFSRLLTGSASYHLWFVVMIFQFYLLFPVFKSAMRLLGRYIKGTKSWLLFLVILLVPYLLIGSDIANGAPSLYELANTMRLPRLVVAYTDRNFVGWYFFFIAGALAGIHANTWRTSLLNRKKAVYVAWGISFVSFTIFTMQESLITGSLRVYIYDANTFLPSVMLLSLISICALYTFSMDWMERSDKNVNRVVRVVGENSYGAYLVHAVFLTLVSYLFRKYLPLSSASIKLGAYALGCAVLSVLLSWLFTKFPLGNLVTGGKKR